MYMNNKRRIIALFYATCFLYLMFLFTCMCIEQNHDVDYVIRFEMYSLCFYGFLTCKSLSCDEQPSPYRDPSLMEYVIMFMWCFSSLSMVPDVSYLRSQSSWLAYVVITVIIGLFINLIGTLYFIYKNNELQITVQQLNLHVVKASSEDNVDVEIVYDVE